MSRLGPLAGPRSATVYGNQSDFLRATARSGCVWFRPKRRQTNGFPLRWNPRVSNWLHTRQGRKGPGRDPPTGSPC